MTRITHLVLLVALSAAACSRAPSVSAARGGLTRDEFVAVMVELGLAQPHQRASILEKHGTNDTEIRAFVRAASRHPSGISQAFDSIQERLDRARLAPLEDEPLNGPSRLR